MKQSTIDFNKEMVLAELGSFICTPLVAYIFSKFTSTPRFISLGAVLGGIVGSSIAFVVARLWDKNRATVEKYAARELLGDLAYLTPVAMLLALIVYYPVVFFLSKYLLRYGFRVTLSAMSGQLVAFTLIAACLNLYRVLLRNNTGKEL